MAEFGVSERLDWLVYRQTVRPLELDLQESP